MKLTKEQKKVVRKIITYIVDFEQGDKPIVMNAPAGTGKSVIIAAVFRELNKYIIAKNMITQEHRILHCDFYTTATINNVVVDLQNALQRESDNWKKEHPHNPPPFKYDYVSSSRTIYSILGYKVQTSLKTGKKVLVRVHNPFEGLDSHIRTKSPINTGAICAMGVMFIDEASIITKGIKKEIEEYIHIPLIYVGDEYQMLAVDSKTSPSVFQKKRKKHLVLKKLMRYDCKQYARYVTRLRANVKVNRIDQIPNKMGDQLVASPTMKDFMKKMHKKFQKDPDNCCIISHTNKTVNKYNKYVRTVILGKSEVITEGDLIYVDGELSYTFDVLDFAQRLVKEKLPKQRDNLLHMFLQKRATYNTRSIKVTVAGYPRVIHFPLGITIHIQTVKGVLKNGSTDDVVIVTKVLYQENNEVHRCPQLMKLIYKLTTFRYGYSSTVHKMQGRTVDNIFVDLYSDSVMWKVSTINEITRFLYIALSRSKKKTFIYGKVPMRLVRATFGWSG